MTVVAAAVVLFAITLVFATLLGVAKERLRVEEDPRIAQVSEVLPAANCGACGFAGCADFAKAVVEGRVNCDGCPVGGPAVTEAVARLLGREMVPSYPYRPVIHCRARTGDKLGLVAYDGVQSCVEADAVGVTQGCTYGCLGFGDCVRACDYDAIHMVDGLPEIDYVKCIGCGACVRACPRNIIESIPFKQEQMLVVACCNKEPGKNVRQVCKVGCIGCKACHRVLAQLFEVRDNLAYIDYDNYTGAEDLDAAAGKCPAKSIVYFGKPKPEYADMLKEEEAAAAQS